MPNTIDYYLAKGIDRPMAEYFASGRKRIVDVQANDDLTLTLTFDNGERRLFNCQPLFTNGSIFMKLLDNDRFRDVYLDDCHCVSWDIDPNVDSDVVWNNKIDLCPDTCYVDSVPH